MFNFFNELQPDENIQIAYKVKLFCETGKLSEDLPVEIRSEVVEYFNNNFSSSLSETEKNKFLNELYDSLYYEAIEPFEDSRAAGEAKKELEVFRAKNIEDKFIRKSDQKEVVRLKVLFSSNSSFRNVKEDFGKISNIIKKNSSSIISQIRPLTLAYIFGWIPRKTNTSAEITFTANKQQKIKIKRLLQKVYMTNSHNIYLHIMEGGSEKLEISFNIINIINNEVKKSSSKTSGIAKRVEFKKQKTYLPVDRKRNRTTNKNFEGK